MNPVVVVHLVAGVVAIAVAVPLTRRRVKMNRWYGVRIPAAFESEEAWFDINHYGGRLLVVWGLVIVATASVGVFWAAKIGFPTIGPRRSLSLLDCSWSWCGYSVTRDEGESIGKAPDRALICWSFSGHDSRKLSCVRQRRGRYR